MTQKVLFIVNPVAGRKLGAMSAQELCAQMEKRGFSVDMLLTASSGDATRIAREKGPQYDAIALTGGDGTLHEVVNGIMALDLRPPLMYIPSGTTNVMASSLGLSGFPRSIASKVLSGTPHLYDVGKVKEKYFAFIASFGAFTEVSYSTSQNMKNSLGYLAYVLQGIRNLSDLRSYCMEIQCDGQIIRDRFIFGAISNSTSVGGVFKFNTDNIRLDDGYFEAMFVKIPSSALALEQIIASLLKGQYMEEYIRFFHVKDIRVASSSPVPWTLDGEYGGDYTNLDVEILPRAICLYH